MGEPEGPPRLVRTCPHGRPSYDGSCIYCYLDQASGEALHVEGKDAAEVGSLLSQLGKGVPAPSDADEPGRFFLWRTSWRRAGTILVGLAAIAAAVAGILPLFIK